MNFFLPAHSLTSSGPLCQVAVGIARDPCFRQRASPVAGPPAHAVSFGQLQLLLAGATPGTVVVALRGAQGQTLGLVANARAWSHACCSRTLSSA